MNEFRDNAGGLDRYRLSAKFSMDSLKTLQLDKELSTPIARRYLSYHVKRYPLDLRVQVQRILMNHDQAQLAGTLQDCFIALKDKGLNLRRELFEYSKDQLSHEEQRYFLDWLNSDFATGYDDRFVSGSVLATGLAEKSEPLLVYQKQTENRYEGHYQEAVDCLEYGQIERAQELLEQELINPDGDSRSENELLRVYSYTKDWDSKRRLKALLEGQGRELSDDWSNSSNVDSV